MLLHNIVVALLLAQLMAFLGVNNNAGSRISGYAGFVFGMTAVLSWPGTEPASAQQLQVAILGFVFNGGAALIFCLNNRIHIRMMRKGIRWPSLRDV